MGGAAVFVLLACLLAFSPLLKQTTNVSVSELSSTTPQEVWVCNADAMLCPDGSSVGRTGPTCQFPECPSPDATFARIETYLNGRDGGLGLTINPREVLADTRCSIDTPCATPGTLEVRAAVETKVAHGEHVFKLGEPRTVGNLTVTLVEVRPSTKEEARNPETGYWFVFEAKRN
jgi:hypothetical protein